MKILKNLGIILIISGIMLLTVDTVSAYVVTFQNENKEVLTIKNNLNSDYDKFISKTIEYKATLSKLAPFFTQYYEEITNSAQAYAKVLKSLEEERNELKDIHTRIREKCRSEIADNSVEQRCKTAIENFREIDNSYQKTYNKFNEVIDEYNDYYKEENNKHLEKYVNTSYN